MSLPVRMSPRAAEPEHRRVHGLRFPLRQAAPQPTEELGPQSGEGDDYGRGEMVPVEPVAIRRSDLFDEDDALPDKTTEHVANSRFGVPPDDPMHLPARESGFRPGEDAEHVSVDGGRDDAEGMVQIHIHIIVGISLKF